MLDDVENYDDMRLLYVREKGTDVDGRRLYQFLFGDDAQKESFWAEGFEEKPSGIAGDFLFEDSQYEIIKELKIYNIKFDLAAR